MGNVESGQATAAGGPNSSSLNEVDHWHGAHPDKEPSLRSPPKVPPYLQRKASSFLEEPVTRKLTERGEAAIINHAAGGREGEEPNVDTFPSSSRFACAKLRYAVSEMQGWRSHMEDKHALNPLLSSNSQQEKLLEDHHLFAVFDGHGGDFASHFCGENFVSTLVAQKDWHRYLKLLANTNGAKSDPSVKQDNVTGLTLLKSALIKTFLAVDAKLLDAQRQRRVSQLSQLESLVFSLGGTVEHDVFQKGTKDNNRVLSFEKQTPSSMPSNVPLERSGSTGVVVLVTPYHILCANAGDSRAIFSKKSNNVILTKDGVLPLSFDHKPTNDVEVSRVEKGGGFVKNGRVDGDLAVSRSFGDFAYKRCNCEPDEAEQQQRVPPIMHNPRDDHVTVHPDILVHTREPTKDEFVVLACDGVWDRLSNRDCADLVRKLIHDEDERDVGLICEEIIDTALELDSRDNMTCCVIVFPGANMGNKGLSSSNSSRAPRRGVMERRSTREQQWGNGSTPAKRAMQRLEERKKKNRELIASQRTKVPKSQSLPRSQTRRMQEEAPGLQLSPSQENGSSFLRGSGPLVAGTVARSQSGQTKLSRGHVNGKKHKAIQSPPRDATRTNSRVRSSKSLRLQAGNPTESIGAARQ